MSLQSEDANATGILGTIPAQIGNIGIESQENPLFPQTGGHYHPVRSSSQPFFVNGLDLMPIPAEEIGGFAGKVFVGFEPEHQAGRGTNRSRSRSAAYWRAAWMA
jgi:hypothetical protein